MMKYLGLALIFLGTYMIIQRQKRAMMREAGFVEELASLFGHIERRVSSYFEGPREWAASYRAKDGEIAYALKRIESGEAPGCSLSDAVKSRKTQHGWYKTAMECISMLGKDELGKERESISRASEKMAELARAEKENATRVIRVRSVLFVLVALGAVIILI